MKLSPLQEQALSVLQTYVDRMAVYDRANATIGKAIGEVTSEFTHGIYAIDGEMLSAVCDLLDAIWGAPDSGVASYFLHECLLGHGGGIRCCKVGAEWKLRNIEDLRAYLEHAQECEGLKEEELAS